MHRSLKRAGFALGALVLILGLAGLADRIPKAGPSLPPLTLPTGETLVLRGVTYGTNHLAPGGSRWRRLLPAPIRPWMPNFFGAAAPLSDRMTAQPRLLVWMEVLSNAPASAPTSAPAQTWVMLADEQGQAAGSRVWLPFFPGLTRFGTVAEFQFFPRRSKQLQVLLIQGSYDKPALIGHWNIPNPQLARAPLWAAEALPATRRQGDLECTVSALFTSLSSGAVTSFGGGGAQARYEPAQPGADVRAAATVSFRERGIPSHTWAIGGLSLADASGNLLDLTSPSWGSMGDTQYLDWGPVLWPAETWEVRLSTKRTSEAHFEPAELVVFPDIPLGSEGVPAGLQQLQQLEGVSIHLTQFVRRKPLDTRRGWSTADASELKATLRGLTNGLFVDLIKVVDDAGRPLKIIGYNSGRSGGISNCAFPFTDVPFEARTLSFTFAVHRGRSFTFRVQPKIATSSITLPAQ